MAGTLLTSIALHCLVLLGQQYVQADTVIVRFVDTVVSLNISAVPAQELPNATLAYHASYLGLDIYRIDPGMNSTVFCSNLKRSANYSIDLCDTDIVVAVPETAQLNVTNDPLVHLQYGLVQSRVPAVWQQGVVGNAEVKVCIVDTGYDLTHPDLQQNLWINPMPTFEDVHGASFVGGTKSALPQDHNGHGTLVAGIIGATVNNHMGTAGIAQEVTMIPCRFMDSTGSGNLIDAIACFDYCIGVGAHIIQNSWGSNSYNQALLAALAATQAAGVLLVTSAGNEGVSDDIINHLPSGASRTQRNVLSVAATDETRSLWGGSNYGTTAVQLAAPGIHIESTALGGIYLSKSGTSFAAPHVTGVAVLLYSYLLLQTVHIDRSAAAAEAVAWSLANSTAAFLSPADQSKVNGTLDAVAALDALKRYLASPQPGGSKLSGFSASAIGFVIGCAVTALLIAAALVVRRRIVTGRAAAAAVPADIVT